MALPDSLTTLAGFALAHALWSLCDLEDEELLVPLAFVDGGEQRRLVRFEGDTQQDAIESAHDFLATVENATRWALARDALMPTPSGETDVLLVTAREVVGGDEVTFVQPYLPALAGTFALLGPPTILVDDQALAGDEADAALAALKAGAMAHEKAAALWPSWKGW